MAEFTEEQIKGYLDNGGVKCPICKSGDISGDEWNADAGGATQEVSCENCGASWLDCYNLTGAILLEGPDEEDGDDDGLSWEETYRRDNPRDDDVRFPPFRP